MKYFVSLIFAALVYGLSEQAAEVSATKELCSVKASVYSIDATFSTLVPGPILLTTKNSINACKKTSGAKVFRQVIIGEKYKSKPLDTQLKFQVAAERVNDLYKNKEFSIYDGIEFIIYNQGKTVVERLVKERSDSQKFSLKMTLNDWIEVGKAVSKYAAKIHHVELEVSVDVIGFVAFKKILQLYPNITFAASNEKREYEITSFVKSHSKKINRKVGYTISRLNLHSHITYTVGI
ncbi:hypothetical protein DSO57_1008317 [Entomophthora muscae]|uniref:Uncharacterized protein n=1 Tax=Entomophthora muscae TaxID=34485 RepID=A0ACC2RLV3_9FUNG|nr:hypothetical protein DSO57_1008317 [Entomophthora muscae]